MTEPLKICLIMLSGKEWMGGAEYIKNIIIALSRLPTETRKTFEIHLLILGEDFLDLDVYQQLKPYLNTVYNLNQLQPRTFINRLRWKTKKIFLEESNPQVSEFLKKIDIDFVYPYFSSKLADKLSFHSCPWIYDFQHKYLPHLFTRHEVIHRDKEFTKIAKLSKRIVLSSNCAASDFCKFFPDSKAEIEVLQFRTPLQDNWCEDDVISIQKKYKLPDRFFLVSNQFWQHKNHKIIFEALKILKDKSIHPIIVYTGNIQDYRNSDYIDTIFKMIQEYSLEAQTYLLGLIPKKDQMQLMRRSIAVIQPSLFEGWSTVVEDARCLGKNIILSDFPVHLEQNPPNSAFFDRYSSSQLADLIDKYWHNLDITPNLDQEALAMDKNKQEVQQFGCRFLEIARNSADRIKI